MKMEHVDTYNTFLNEKLGRIDIVEKMTDQVWPHFKANAVVI